MEPARDGTHELFPRDSVIITRDLSGFSDGPVQAKEADCCFTYIQFEKLYPGDVTARVILRDGRSPERKFTTGKTVRTALVRPDGNEGEDTTGQVLVGGLGRCVDVDIEIADTSSALAKIAHYHFRLCCTDPTVQKGARLTAKIDAASPGGQVVNYRC